MLIKLKNLMEIRLITCQPRNSTDELVHPFRSCSSVHRRLFDRFYHRVYVKKAFRSSPIQWQPLELRGSCNEWHLDHRANLSPSQYRTCATSSHRSPCCQGRHWFRLVQRLCEILLGKVLLWRQSWIPQRLDRKQLSSQRHLKSWTWK